MQPKVNHQPRTCWSKSLEQAQAEVAKRALYNLACLQSLSQAGHQLLVTYDIISMPCIWHLCQVPKKWKRKKIVFCEGHSNKDGVHDAEHTQWDTNKLELVWSTVQSTAAVTGDIGSADAGMHCEIKQDVILRLETLTVKETKVSVQWQLTYESKVFQGFCLQASSAIQPQSRVLMHFNAHSLTLGLAIHVALGSCYICMHFPASVWFCYDLR